MIDNKPYDALDLWVDYDSIASLVSKMNLENSFTEMRMIENVRGQCLSVLVHAILSVLLEEDYLKIKNGFTEFTKDNDTGVVFDSFLLTSAIRLPYVKMVGFRQLKLFLTKLA